MIGTEIGRYHIVSALGEGGMATVYKAQDLRLERFVALKVILANFQQTELFLKRFDREAKSLAKLTHPNIVGVIDYGTHKGMPYLVMEYISGGTLKDRLHEAMPWQAAVKFLTPVAHALAYAHSKNVIHRDIKPANILVTDTGEPMLTDFGIAKVIGTDSSVNLTGTGVGIGTPDYMAPEQGMGAEVDHRADIYSLGIVFYQLIAGRPPFRADTPLAVMVKHINEPLPHPREYVPNLPVEVELVLLKALAKDPAQRYQNMDEFAAALEGLTGLFATAEKQLPTAAPIPDPTPETPSVTPPPPARKRPVAPSAPKPAPRKKPRLWLWVLGSGTGMIGLVLCAIIFMFGSAVVVKLFQPDPTATLIAIQPTATQSATLIPTSANNPADEDRAYSVSVGDDGWTTYLYQDLAFSIVLPPHWVHLDLSAGGFDEILSVVTENNPDLAAAFPPEYLENIAATGIKLMAIDASADSMAADVATNINVLVADLPYAVSFDDYVEINLQQLYSMLGEDIQISQERIRIGGLEAATIIYEAEIIDAFGKAQTVLLQQILVLKDDTQYVLTFTSETRDIDKHVALFEEIMARFSLVE